MGKLLDRIFGTHSDQEIKKIIPIVDLIESMSDEKKQKTDSELKEYTNIF